MGSITKRVVVFGRGSWLGRSIARYFQAVLSDADITDRAQVAAALTEHGGGIAINAAAKTGGDSVDGCDRSPATQAETFRVNAVGPMYLMDECRRTGTQLVHLSTTYVFADTPPDAEGFSEDARFVLPSRTSYAGSKAAADLMLQQFPAALVLRINLPIGETPDRRNFITRLAGYPSVQDVRHSLTTVPTLLSVMSALMSRGSSGLYHVVHQDTVTNGQLIGWYRELVDPHHRAPVVPAGPSARPGIIVRPTRLINEGVWPGRTEPAVRACLTRYARALQ